MIELKNVTKKFGGVAAVSNVTLTVKKGQIHGFLGPNGAGKTTTIKMLMDYIRPSSGEIKIFELDAHKDTVEIKRNVGYLSGDMEFYTNMTGAQYLKYVANLRGDGDYKHLSKIIKKLEPTLNKKIGTLSRGNKQKIGLLAALMDDPDLLILDEPTSGLDPLMQQVFYDVLRDHARRGKTVFMSSHILGEVQEVCDVISFMKKGEIVETINVNELLASTKRRVTLHYEKSAAIVEPTSQLGASNIHKTKTTLGFDVTVADRKVMRWIAMQPVTDVTIVESDLDSVFIGMYEEVSDVQ